MIESIFKVIDFIVGYLWGPATFFVLLGTGILFTLWTKFCQFKAFSHGIPVIRGLYDNPDDPGAISHFQALSAALSATVGLGNIGGVALAVGIGGPGSIFWLWVTGFLGMAIKTVEVTLAMIFRNVDDPENPSGGAMWVIDKSLGQRGAGFRKLAKFLGFFFCTTLLISTITGGNMFQAWNVADLTNLYFGVPKIGTGIVLAILTGLVIIGGIKRIGSVADKLVPFMCGLYILAGLFVMAINIPVIPETLFLIFKHAFSPAEASGAFLGASVGFAFQVGMKRALFSNEAGQGSAPIAHSAAKTDEPVREGIVAGLEPFIDTILICTLTAMVIMVTGTWNRQPFGEMKGPVELQEVNGAMQLAAPTEFAALPDLPSWEKWYPGAQVFFVLEVGSERHKVMGTLMAGQEGQQDTIAWDKPPQNATWLKKEDGQPDKRIYRDFKGATLTSHAFDRALPGLGKWLVTLAAWLFAVSTMISWSYYGEQGVVYMFGRRGVLPYKLIFLLMAVIAPIFVSTDYELGVLADFGTGLMLWANIPIILSMGYLAVSSIDTYWAKLKAGEFKRFH